MPLIQRKAKLNDFVVGHASGRTKPRPQSAVTTTLFNSFSNKFSSGYLGSGGSNNNFVYAYHAEKVRAKFKTTTVLFKSGPNKGKVKSRTAETIRQGGWKLRVFKFPMDRVKSFKQFDRHFEIVLN